MGSATGNVPVCSAERVVKKRRPCIFYLFIVDMIVKRWWRTTFVAVKCNIICTTRQWQLVDKRVPSYLLRSGAITIELLLKFVAIYTLMLNGLIHEIVVLLKHIILTRGSNPGRRRPLPQIFSQSDCMLSFKNESMTLS